MTQHPVPPDTDQDQDEELDLGVGAGDIIAFSHQIGRCGCRRGTKLASCRELAAAADTIREEEASGLVPPGWAALLDQLDPAPPPRRGLAGLLDRFRDRWSR